MSESQPIPPAPAASSPAARAWQRFRRNRTAFGSFLFLLATLAFLGGWPALSPHGANITSEDQFQAPDGKFWCGTDIHGRDLFVRLCVGGQVSLLVGVVGACVSLVIGVTWGAVAGYGGGRIDAVMMRIVDVLYALPSIIFVMLLIAVVEGPVRRWAGGWVGGDVRVGLRLLFLCVGLGTVSWLTMARIVRGQVLTLRTRPFIDASRALGASPLRLLGRHILPNLAGVIIVYLTLTVPAVILYESFLSFLGLGIQPPMASLGALIAEGASQLNPIRTYWWLVVFPALALVVTLLALNFLGDGLRDALDPKSL